MTTLWSRLLLVGVLFSLMLGAPARAQPASDPSPIEWQAVIAGQILAFRNHDAPGALFFASAPFHARFENPAEFFISIITSGYAPIMDSTSQSFGPYKLLAPDQVLQEVKLVGNDQNIYEAVYALSKEEGGWRVGGVQLTKTSAVGV
jgi:hypothetical protein